MHTGTSSPTPTLWSDTNGRSSPCSIVGTCLPRCGISSSTTFGRRRGPSTRMCSRTRTVVEMNVLSSSITTNSQKPVDGSAARSGSQLRIQTAQSGSFNARWVRAWRCTKMGAILRSFAIMRRGWSISGAVENYASMGFTSRWGHIRAMSFSISVRSAITSGAITSTLQPT